MIITLAYYSVLVAVLVYLAIYGGRTGRWGGLLQLATSLLSLILAMLFIGTPTVVPLLHVVDFLSLIWKTALALASTRWWPIWLAGFQLISVAAHVSILLLPHWEGLIYYAMTTVWAIPSLLVMLIGTALDRRHETRVNS